MTQRQVVLEVTVAGCSTQLVQHMKTLVVRTLVVCAVAHSGRKSCSWCDTDYLCSSGL